MDPNLKNAIVEAVSNNAVFIVQHRNRGEDNANDHSNIDKFQQGICRDLNLFPNCVFNNDGKCNCTNPQWSCEYAPSGEYKDSIDIYGKNILPENKPCIIEIDAVRHDQIAAKFVSRAALCGLEGPIDYVAILYESTQKSGRKNGEKFIRYTYSILKKLNSKSSLLGIYVYVVKDENGQLEAKVERWDCELQGYSVNGTEYKSMSECARGAVKEYITKCEKLPTFYQLQQVFTKPNGSSYVFNSKASGKGHKAVMIKNLKTADGYPIFVDTQFRAKGNQSNWIRFTALCKQKNINIDIKQTFLQN